MSYLIPDTPPDPNNPFIAWPMKKLLESEYSVSRVEFLELYKNMINSENRELGFNPEISLYDNLFVELLFRTRDNIEAAETLYDHVEWMIDPKNIKKDTEMMSTQGIENSLIDIEQWVLWELEMYLTLVKELFLPLGQEFIEDVEELKDIYPKAWKKSLEATLAERYDELGKAS